MTSKLSCSIATLDIILQKFVGSLIPIPGVGTAVGFVVGGVVCIIVDVLVSDLFDELIDKIAK